MRRMSIRTMMMIVLISAIGLAAGIQPEKPAKPPTRAIQGTITLEGYPLPKGRLTLFPPDAPPKFAEVEDGAFAMADVPLGLHSVSVSAEGVPMIYGHPASSGLKVRVKGGPDSIRLDLAARGIEAGKPAPHILAYNADGNIVPEPFLRGKWVLLAFWSIQPRTPTIERHYALVRRIRRDVFGRENFLILSVCIDALEGEDGAPEAWNRFVTGQPPIDDRDGNGNFISDRRWWQCMAIPGVNDLPSAPRYGVRREFQFFLIAPDGRFAAIRIPETRLRAELEKALLGGRAQAIE